MKIEIDGWTVEDVGSQVWLHHPSIHGYRIGGGKTGRSAAFDHLEDKFAKATGVTALTVAAELERYLKEEKDDIVHGYKVAKDTTVTQPDGRSTEPVKYKEGYYDCGDKVSNYVRRNTSTSATQADVVAKIKEYFEGPRVVKGYKLHRWNSDSDWYVRDQVSADLIGHGQCSTLGRGVGKDFKAAQAKFAAGEPSLPEVAEFIENYRDSWHASTLQCERDDADNVVIGTPGKQFIRLSLATGKATVHTSAEEAKA